MTTALNNIEHPASKKIIEKILKREELTIEDITEINLTADSGYPIYIVECGEKIKFTVTGDGKEIGFRYKS